MGYTIRKINHHNVKTLEPLAEAAEKEGFEFVGRAIGEFLNRENDFSRSGEVLYGVYNSELCIGICGLNIDPYTSDEGIGRLRHLYVLPVARKMGVGEFLVGRIIEEAENNFEVIRLRSTPVAMAFYDKMGFERSDGEHESHRMILRKEI